MIRLVLAGAISSIAIGCATVPKEAPQAFHDAKASVDRMNESEADEYFPQTVDRANESFKAAIAMWDEDEPNAILTAAEEKAKHAKKTADGAVVIAQKIQAWDESETDFLNALAIMNKANSAIAGLGVEKEEASPFAKLKGAEVTSTLAYFGSGNSHNPDLMNSEVDSMVNILRNNPKFGIILTGFSDPTGNVEMNERLALERAQSVANTLKERGIEDSQITVRAAEVGPTTNMKSKGQLQLKRRVQGVVTFD